MGSTRQVLRGGHGAVDPSFPVAYPDRAHTIVACLRQYFGERSPGRRKLRKKRRKSPPDRRAILARRLLEDLRTNRCTAHSPLRRGGRSRFTRIQEDPNP